MIKLSSKVCSIIAAGGVALTAFFTYKGTVKAYKKVEELDISEPKKNKKLIFKEVYKFFIPSALCGVGTIAAITGAKVIDAKAQAAMAASITALKKSYDKYGDAVEKVFGLEGSNAVKKEIVHETPVTIDPEDDKELYFLGYGYDDYFRANPRDVEQGEYVLNKYLRTNHTVNLGVFLDEVGVEPTHLSTLFGWGRHELYNDMEDGWIIVEEELAESDNGEICHMLSFNCAPSEDFEETDKWYQPGEPLDRDVPFDTNPTQDDLFKSLYKGE